MEPPIDECEFCDSPDTTTLYCVDCSSRICKSCGESHVKVKAFRFHAICAHPKEQDIHCSIHPKKELDIFCENCCTFICSYCAITDHNDHRIVIAVEHVIARLQEELGLHKLKLLKLLTTSTENFASLMEQKERYLMKSGELHAKVDVSYENLLLVLNATRQRAHEAIGNQIVPILDDIGDELNKLTRNIDKLNESCASLTSAVDANLAGKEFALVLKNSRLCNNDADASVEIDDKKYNLMPIFLKFRNPDVIGTEISQSLFVIPDLSNPRVYEDEEGDGEDKDGNQEELSIQQSLGRLRCQVSSNDGVSITVIPPGPRHSGHSCIYPGGCLLAGPHRSLHDAKDPLWSCCDSLVSNLCMICPRTLDKPQFEKMVGMFPVNEVVTVTTSSFPK